MEKQFKILTASIEAPEASFIGVLRKDSTPRWDLKKPDPDDVVVEDCTSWFAQDADIVTATVSSFRYDKQSPLAHTVQLRKECQKLLHEFSFAELETAAQLLRSVKGGSLVTDPEEMEFVSTIQLEPIRAQCVWETTAIPFPDPSDRD